MESAICKRAAIEVSILTNDINITSNSFGVESLLSYSTTNDDIMQDPLKNKEIAMCILSKLAYSYEDTDKIDNIVKNWNIKYKVVILETLVYIIFYSAKMDSTPFIFIVFKGTTNFSEVISDIDFIQIDDSYDIPGKMHRGFHNLILKNNVIDSIDNTLKEIISLNEKSSIIVTGHSLGAALATIFYAYLLKAWEDITNIELITFGSPRVGDNDFSKNLNGKRYVHGNDIITKLPIFKYKHLSTLIKLGSNYSCRVFTDHLLEGYYKELLKTQ